MYLNLILLVTFINLVNSKSYLDFCQKKIYFGHPCMELNFNQDNCFPWDERHCSVTRKYREPCTTYDCSVILFFFLKISKIKSEN